MRQPYVKGELTQQLTILRCK